MILTIEQRLYQYAYETLGYPVYPEQTTGKEAEINAKNAEITRLRDGITPRPATKTAYIQLLNNLVDELSALLQENEQIIIANQNAINQVNADWHAAVQEFMNDPANLETLPPSLEEQIETLVILVTGGA